MSAENVEQYRRVAEAFERHDLDAFLAPFAADVEFSPRSVDLDGGGPYQGHDGIRKWWEAMFTVFSDYVGEIDEVEDLGDLTFSRVRLRGHGMGSGAPMEQTQWHVVEWRDGKAVRWRTLRTEAEALKAAGLAR